jgi:hypothetical protein
MVCTAKTHNLTLSAHAAMIVVLSLAVVPALITTTYAAPQGREKAVKIREGTSHQDSREKAKAGV